MSVIGKGLHGHSPTTASPHRSARQETRQHICRMPAWEADWYKELTVILVIGCPTWVFQNTLQTESTYQYKSDRRTFRTCRQSARHPPSFFHTPPRLQVRQPQSARTTDGSGSMRRKRSLADGPVWPFSRQRYYKKRSVQLLPDTILLNVKIKVFWTKNLPVCILIIIFAKSKEGEITTT